MPYWLRICFGGGSEIVHQENPKFSCLDIWAKIELNILGGLIFTLDNDPKKNTRSFVT